jgi:hypothetical protein
MWSRARSAGFSRSCSSCARAGTFQTKMTRILAALVLLAVGAVVVLYLMEKVSETVFAAMLGSLPALLGVCWTLSYMQNQFRESVAAEDRQKREERRFAAKQHAFIAALEAAVPYIHFIVSLPDRDVVPGKKNPAAEAFGIAMNKLHFYCELETIEEAADFAETGGKIALRLMETRRPVSFIDNDIRDLENAMSYCQNRIQQLNAEANTRIARDPNDPEVIVIRRDATGLTQRILEATERRAALYQSRYEAIARCHEVLVEELPRLIEIQTSLMIAARRELEFKIPVAEYRRLMEGQAERMGAALRSAMERTREEINKRLAQHSQVSSDARIA